MIVAGPAMTATATTTIKKATDGVAVNERALIMDVWQDGTQETVERSASVGPFFGRKDFQETDHNAWMFRSEVL